MTHWHALVIGVDRYPAFPRKQLSGCVNDANAVAGFLLQRVQVPPTRLRCLTSPRTPAPDSVPATAANIRGEFAALAGRVAAGDHVILYYAGHGLQLSLDGGDGARYRYYGFAPEDIAPSATGYANVILGSEVHRLLTGIEATGASATVIADTCHSGASTRAIDDDPRERVLRVLPLSAAESRDFASHHPALQGGPRDVNAGPFGAYAGGDYVMLTGCLDSETSKEDHAEVLDDAGAPTKVAHGLLTLALLKELEAVPADGVAALRWMDFFERLRRTVAQRAVDIRSSSQTATLEGRREKRVFGGAWRPFAPGFTVRAGHGMLTLDGGELQGFEPGAIVMIHPPDTSDFDRATDGVEAVVDTATPMTSVLRLREPAALVADLSRARLARPGPGTAPIVVRVPGEALMPAGLRDELTRQLSGVNGATIVEHQSAGITPAHAELRRWTGSVPASVWPSPEAWANARDGWILVRTDRFGAPSGDAVESPSADDIVAYLPDLDDTTTAAALAQGLSGYGRYLQKRDRRAGDVTLASMLNVTLRAGDGPEPANPAAVAALPVVEPADGIYHLTEDHWMWVQIRVTRRTSLRLQVGWVMFSDDGNIVPLWPPEGSQPTLSEGSLVLVGYDRESALSLTKRADQTTSMYTLAVIASTGPADGPPLNLAGLAQASVQAEFAAAIARARGHQSRGEPLRRPAVTEQPAWFAWHLRLAITAGRR